MHDCLPPDCFVPTPNGFKKIQDLVAGKRIGEEVYGLDWKGNVVRSKILLVSNGGFSDHWIEFHGNILDKEFILKCTTNHCVYIHPDIHFEACMIGIGMDMISFDNLNLVRGNINNIKLMTCRMTERFNLSTATGNFFVQHALESVPILVHS